MWSVLILLATIPVFICCTNAILNRVAGTRPHRTPFTAGFYANLIFLPAYVVVHIKTFGSEWVSLLCGVAFTFLFLNCVAFLNWFIFTLTDVSMHIQLMTQLYKLGPIPTEQLLERYNKKLILSNRVPRLLELGQLRLENGRLYINGGSVLLCAYVCVLLRRLLGIPALPQDADHHA